MNLNNCYSLTFTFKVFRNIYIRGDAEINDWNAEQYKKNAFEKIKIAFKIKNCIRIYVLICQADHEV